MLSIYFVSDTNRLIYIKLAVVYQAELWLVAASCNQILLFFQRISVFAEVYNFYNRELQYLIIFNEIEGKIISDLVLSNQL